MLARPDVFVSERDFLLVLPPDPQVGINIATWSPSITQRDTQSAMRALDLSQTPAKLPRVLAKISRTLCFDVFDIAAHGRQRNLRATIYKLLSDIAAGPSSAAASLRLPWLGTMGLAEFAVRSFIETRLGTPKSGNMADCFEWASSAQHLAKQVKSRLRVARNPGTPRDLPMYVFAGACIDAVNEFAGGDLSLPQPMNLDEDTSGPLFSFTRAARDMSIVHCRAMIERLQSVMNALDPDLVLRCQSEIRLLSETKRATRLDRPLLEHVIEFVEKVAPDMRKTTVRKAAA